jgi:hypothetical protein
MASHSKRIWIIPAVLAATMTALWAFPSVWYTKRTSDKVYWFREAEEVAGWSYTSEPIDKAAEALLVGDRMVNGEFVAPDRTAIRVFSAKRYKEKANEIGLFVHTPDRCWTQVGWKIDMVAPDVLEIELHGIRIPVERRVFVHQTHRELVYFAGLVGGEPLPYRLDHHLSVARRYQVKERMDKSGAALRASDGQFWGRLWDSFTNRRQLLGPKHFIRISTPIRGDISEADRKLQEFLPLWLTPIEYAIEESEWAAAKVAQK